MRKWIAVAAMLLTPIAAKAQYVEVQHGIIAQSGYHLDFFVMLRNTQPLTPGELFEINGFRVGGAPACGMGCTTMVSPATTIGSIDLRTFDDPGVDDRTLRGTLMEWGYSDSGFGEKQLGPETAVSPGFGLIGCSLPVLNPQGGPDYYGGRNCAAEGYDGWLRIEGRISYDFLRPATFTEDDLVVTVQTRTRAIATYSAVPEPSTYALTAAGLAALGLVARRRRGA